MLRHRAVGTARRWFVSGGFTALRSPAAILAVIDKISAYGAYFGMRDAQARTRQPCVPAYVFLHRVALFAASVVTRRGTFSAATGCCLLKFV